MAIAQLADDWFAAVRRYCNENGLACLRDDQLSEYMKKMPMVLHYRGMRGMDTALVFPTSDAYKDMIHTMVGDGAIALCPELTVNGAHPGGTLVSGTCNLRLVVLKPLVSMRAVLYESTTDSSRDDKTV
jgi:hypothetical protein